MRNKNYLITLIGIFALLLNVGLADAARYWGEVEDSKTFGVGQHDEEVCAKAKRFLTTDTRYDERVVSIGSCSCKDGYAGNRNCELAFKHQWLKYK